MVRSGTPWRRWGRSLTISAGAIAAALLISGSAMPATARPGDRITPADPSELGCEPVLTLPELPIHDPFILADEAGIYYLYSDRSVRRSVDLIQWCAPVTVFPRSAQAGSWADLSGNWAPEVHKYNGKYYLFTTLHNRSQVLEEAHLGGQHMGNGHRWQNTHQRGTIIAVADDPLGPFQLLSVESPVAPIGHMTLDGTLYVDPGGQPWMVYAHEWVQKIDGTMNAIPLETDADGHLTGYAGGEPIWLFKGSDAPWYWEEAQHQPVDDVQLPPYVTDGPAIHTTRNGELVMLWSSYRGHNAEYVVAKARSRSGDLAGPWEQEGVFVTGNKGHAMLFRSFEGQLLMALHNNMNLPNTRTELYQLKETGRDLQVVRQRTDLDGDPCSVFTCPPSL